MGLLLGFGLLDLFMRPSSAVNLKNPNPSVRLSTIISPNVLEKPPFLFCCVSDLILFLALFV